MSSQTPVAVPSEARSQAVHIRCPSGADGASVWSLIAQTPALDGNSLYCNLLQCTHFAETCAVAESEGEVVGWLSAYVPPGQPDTLFVWQVCVAESARGQGLAHRLLTAILQRPGSAAIRFIQSTITADNSPSWALFEKVARALDAPLQRQPHFDREVHFGGTHATEHLVTIGPFAPEALGQATAA